MKLPAIAALTLLAATPAAAQTYVPGQSQARNDRLQLQLQQNRLQQLQRQNMPALQSADPGARMQAQVRQQQIQQQTDQTNAVAQQMQAPGADPAAINARLQQNGDDIRSLQPPLPPVR